MCDRVVVVLGSHADQVRAGAEREFQGLVARNRLAEDLAAARRRTGLRGSARAGRGASARGASRLEVRFVVHRGWRQGMLSSARAGLSACPKHFPGKGHSPLDAHLKLPTIDSTPEEMRSTHLPPFIDALAAGVAAVMTSHPVYPKLDPSGVPATFSRRLVEDWLRGELNFGGVIVSDDLEMGAVSETCPIGEAAVRTAAAGHDLLLVCHTAPAQRAAAAALVEAYRSGRLARIEGEAAAERVRRLRRSPTAGRWPRPSPRAR